MPGNPKQKRGRGRGTGSGRGRGRSDVSSSPTPPSVPIPSTSRTYEDEHAIVKDGMLKTKQRLKKLTPSLKKEYVERKKKKELERILLPDAPSRKRSRNISPERSSCRLMLGTPTTPPPPKLQPWQIKNTTATSGVLPATPDGRSTPAVQLIPAVLPNVLPMPDGRSTPAVPPIPAVLPNVLPMPVGRSMPAVFPMPAVPPIPVVRPNVLPMPVGRSMPAVLPMPAVPPIPAVLPNALPMPVGRSTPTILPAPVVLPTPAVLRTPDVHPSPTVKPPPTVLSTLDMSQSEAKMAEWISKAMVEDLSDEEEEGDIAATVDDNYDYINTQPAHLPDGLNHAVTDWLASEDAVNDNVLRELMPPDQFNFDWTCDSHSFLGAREEFTGKAGPTFTMDENVRPLDVFLKFFDDELFDLLIKETNKYSSYLIDKEYTTPFCRLNRWTNTDRGEMSIFLAILIFQGLLPLTVESDYWKENGYLTLKYFSELMKYNRFLLMKRLLHLTHDSTENLTEDEIKLRKIQPLLNILQRKFSSLYFPSREIAIDESLLKWHGRLSFAQKISTKAAKVGIKSYELCESSTGYLWNFFVYAGKGKDGQTDATDRQTKTTDGQTDTADEENDEQIIDLTTDEGDLMNRQTDGQASSSFRPPPPSNATARIVHDLAKPLFMKGYTIVMDNFYNSPLLARYLKANGTDCFGTLRLHREFVPESIKSVSKHELRTGEVLQSYCRDLYVMLWRDSNLVSMISTFHGGEVGGKEKYGRYKYKPQIVLHYNQSMGGVDRKDQLLSSHPMERCRNQIWYKKVFRRLLNVTILNTFIIFKTRHPSITHRKFRTLLAEQLVQMGKPEPIPKQVTVTLGAPMHSGKTRRPILTGSHFIVNTGKDKRGVCVWCRKCRSRYTCKQCNITLCLDVCFEEFHSKP